MSCPICATTTAAVIHLPGFIDGRQSLEQCQECGHGVLSEQHPQNSPYLSASTEYSRSGIAWFQGFIGDGWECALDFGCNDGLLLRGINAKRRIGVDLYETAEGVEMHKSLDTVDAAPDLVIARHTLEHLADPMAALRALVDKAAPNATFVIEVPCFDSAIKSLRYDQIHNGHYQYFTLGSLHRAVGQAGLQVQTVGMNHNMLSMLVLCHKGKDRKEHFPIPEVGKGYSAFKTYMLAASNIFMLCDQRMAWGASAVFPVLLYHLSLKPAEFVCIIDDDPQKVGTLFCDIPVRSPEGIYDGTVLITAPHSFDKIYRRLTHVRFMSAVPIL